MAASVWSPLHAVLNWLSMLPQWVRPWCLLLAVLLAGWALLFRSVGRILVVYILRAGIALITTTITALLAVEFVMTKHRRLIEKQPLPFAVAVSEVLEAISFRLFSLNDHLTEREYKRRRWPVRTIAMVSGLGLLCWIVFASAPTLAVPSAFGGQAYGLWRQVEVWGRVSSERLTMATVDPAPALVLRPADVRITTSKAHGGRKIEIGPGSPAAPLATVVLDANGNGVIRLTKANRRYFARGGVYRIEWGATLFYVRLV